MAKKVKVRTVKPEEDEKVVKKVKREKTKKETKVMNEKKEKIYRVLDEIKAFLVIVLIIFVVTFAGWYWYTHFYSEDRVFMKKPVKSEEIAAYDSIKYVSEDKRDLKVLNKKYLIEYEDNNIYKIMDLKSRVLYEGEFKFTEIYEGIDDNLYVTRVETTGYENIINLYVLKNNELEEIRKISESRTYYQPIKYYDEKNEEFKLVGFVAFKNGFDEDMEEFSKSYIYNILDDEIKELDGYQLFGDSVSLKETEDEVITFDEKYIVINNLDDKSKRYGLYDLENNKIIVKPQYEGMFTNKDDDYIVVKNKKYGIVNKSLKKIVNFEYDFIDNQDNYYVVLKDNKMALMDNEYNLITKFLFDYQDKGLNTGYSYLSNNKSFKAFKVNDKYVLIANYKEYSDNIDYSNHETYVINSDGTYTKIFENEFYVDEDNSLIYSFDKEKRVYTLYDHDMKKMYDIDISNYDYSGRAILRLINESTIEIKLDSEIYYDYKTGEETNIIKDVALRNGDIDIIYKHGEKEVSYQFSNKELVSIKVDKSLLDKKLYVNVDEGSFYYIANNQYIFVYRT